MQKDNIIINSIEKNHEITTYTGCYPICKIKSITVGFFLKNNVAFSGKFNIPTNIELSEEQIKNKIIEVLQ